MLESESFIKIVLESNRNQDDWSRNRKGVLESESLKLESPQDCNALNTAMERVGFETHDWTKKMVGLGSDGVAVMTGKKGGVIGKLKADQH